MISETRAPTLLHPNSEAYQLFYRMVWTVLPPVLSVELVQLISSLHSCVTIK